MAQRINHFHLRPQASCGPSIAIRSQQVLNHAHRCLGDSDAHLEDDSRSTSDLPPDPRCNGHLKYPPAQQDTGRRPPSLGSLGRSTVPIPMNHTLKWTLTYTELLHVVSRNFAGRHQHSVMEPRRCQGPASEPRASISCDWTSNSTFTLLKGFYITLKSVIGGYIPDPVLLLCGIQDVPGLGSNPGTASSFVCRLLFRFPALFQPLQPSQHSQCPPYLAVTVGQSELIRKPIQL